jgi:hypothetical protein
MMKTKLLDGLLAGAAGTAALNATTYADMVLRNRPPSELPQQMVDALAQKAGLPPPKEHRRTGLGALLGYADGFTAGTILGVIRPSIPNVPWYVAALGLAAFTMVMSEGTATAMGRANPRTWSATAWIADLVPRFIYGAVTTLTFDLLWESSTLRRAEQSRAGWKMIPPRRGEYSVEGVASERLRIES